ncbi:MAG TPA: hypothetical protein VFM93_04010 [Candidatus Limnocylindria bacterium]|nr:hypothetical protein [Candidatus Limnocylindria bacterium]
MAKHGHLSSRVARAIGIGLTSTTLVIAVATAVVAQSALDGFGAVSAVPASTVAQTAALASARESESGSVAAGANEGPAALAAVRSFRAEPAPDRQGPSEAVLAALDLFRVQLQEADPTSTASARPGWGCGDKNHTHTGPPGRPNATSPCK